MTFQLLLIYPEYAIKMSANLTDAGKKQPIYPSCTAYIYNNTWITNSHGIQTKPCNKRSLPELQADIINIPFCIYMSLNGCIHIILILQRSLEIETDGGISRTYYPRIVSDA